MRFHENVPQTKGNILGEKLLILKCLNFPCSDPPLSLHFFAPIRVLLSAVADVRAYACSCILYAMERDQMYK